MKIERYTLISLVVVLVISLTVNIILYSYWFAHDYPHGTKGISTDYIKFHQDYYGIVDYVTIGGNCYEIKGFDVEDALENQLNSWWNVNYTYEEDKDYFNNDLKYYNMTDDRLFTFEVDFHTYDAMGDGNSIYYYKQKVIDSLCIRASQYPKPLH